MSRLFRFTLLVALCAGWPVASQDGNWSSWRGDLAGTGIVRDGDLPLKWDTKKNVRWRVPLPDRGNSTPIVWGDKVFITQATESDKQRSVICFDKKNGALLWQKGVKYTKPEQTHKTNPYCSGSPVTDGRVVVANYASAGVAAYDLDGEELWHRDLGPQEHVWGNGTSPVLFGDICILYHGPGPNSTLYGLDKLSGRTLWKRKIEEKDDAKRVDGFRGRNGGINGAFTTPIVVEVNGRHEVILSGANILWAFNPEDGGELWKCSGLNPLVYTSPVYDGNVVLSMGGYFGASIAVKPGGKGDVTAKRVWHDPRSKKNRLGTAVIRNGYAFFANMSGFAECVDMKTGKVVF
ncbi:MAG: PQQ-binding-like beta-propeller repeat protein, partial [Verrucomicrobiota bacterium]|nr:PQQ-binding-like beta-propeller repeat protein [Verrucomicrobiota bacterium]